MSVSHIRMIVNPLIGLGLSLSFSCDRFIATLDRIIRLRATIQRNSMKCNICQHLTGKRGAREGKRERVR